VANIAMWGATASGKTTFLASLGVALTQAGGVWSVAAADKASTNELIDLTSALHGKKTFPPATQGVHLLEWVLHGTVQETVPAGRWRKETRTRAVSVGLSLADPTGEAWRSDNRSNLLQDELVDRLADSQGIVYVFDPIREFKEGDAYQHTFGVCTQLAGRLTGTPGFDGRLPHYVAVCITKFDELLVYETAKRLGLVTTDPLDRFGFPRVPDDDAPELFGKLCEVSGSGDGDMIIKELYQRFRAERIRFFVSSAIGFYADPRTNRFDPSDPQNLVPDSRAPGGFRIRGPVHPINIGEPVIWLSERITGQQSTVATR
jgi:energy-coupling factor transporter ATP-binding protein EcfA2